MIATEIGEEVVVGSSGYFSSYKYVFLNNKMSGRGRAVKNGEEEKR